MECTEEGYAYELDNIQSIHTQEIVFLKKIGEEVIHDGTTNEEVVEMLIDRMKYLDTKFPCLENKMVIVKLEESVAWLANARSHAMYEAGKHHGMLSDG